MGRHWKEEAGHLGESTRWHGRTKVLDDRGLVTTLTDRRDRDTTFVFDGAGRRTSATDALGNLTV